MQACCLRLSEARPAGLLHLRGRAAAGAQRAVTTLSHLTLPRMLVFRHPLHRNSSRFITADICALLQAQCSMIRAARPLQARELIPVRAGPARGNAPAQGIPQRLQKACDAQLARARTQGRGSRAQPPAWCSPHGRSAGLQCIHSINGAKVRTSSHSSAPTAQQPCVHGGLQCDAACWHAGDNAGGEAAQGWARVRTHNTGTCSSAALCAHARHQPCCLLGVNSAADVCASVLVLVVCFLGRASKQSYILWIV